MLGNPGVGLCFAHVQMASPHPIINQWPQSLSLLSRSALFLLLRVTSVTYITLRSFLQTSHAVQRTIVFPYCFTKKKFTLCIWQVLTLTALETWQVLNYKNKHGEVRKLPEFSLCWLLVLYSPFFFQKENETSQGFLIDVAPFAKSLPYKYTLSSGSTQIHFFSLCDRPTWCKSLAISR